MQNRSRSPGNTLLNKKILLKHSTLYFLKTTARIYCNINKAFQGITIANQS